TSPRSWSRITDALFQEPHCSKPGLTQPDRSQRDRAPAGPAGPGAGHGHRDQARCGYGSASVDRSERASRALLLLVQDLLQQRQRPLGVATRHRLDRLAPHLARWMRARDRCEIRHHVATRTLVQPAEALDGLALYLDAGVFARNLQQQLACA